MRFRFIDAERANYPVAILCRCLQVSRAGYYAWARRAASARSIENAELGVAIKAAHTASRRTYGSPRIHRGLQAQGRRVSRRRVASLMADGGLQGCHKRRFRTTTDSNHQSPIAANLLMREFDAPAPDVAWATDTTHLRTLEGWLYLAAIVDLFSWRVVGYGISDRIDTSLAMVVDYIDRLYSPVRRHSSIGYMSPIEYELRRGVPADRGGIKPKEQEGPAQAA